MVATAVFQLIEDGKLALDDQVKQHLSQLPYAWADVQIKHLLAHASGIPNMIRFDSRLPDNAVWEKLINTPVDFAPGEHWSYNQTNYWLLAQLIEKASGKTFKQFIIDRQFGGNADGVLFSSNPLTVIPDRLSKYNYNAQAGGYEHSNDVEQSRGYAGNGLNIRLDRLIEWNARFDGGELLSDSGKQQMWSAFPFTKSDRRFLYGWDDYSSETYKSYGFTGGGVSAIRKFPEQDLSVLLLTNGFRYMPVHNQIVDRLAGMLVPALKNEQAIAEARLSDAFFTESTEKGIRAYQQIKQQQPEDSFEGLLNQIGYSLLRWGQISDALAVFRLNVAEYPDSANVYDSLGEALLANGQPDASLKQYRKALALNPESANARRMIDSIEARLQEQ